MPPKQNEKLCPFCSSEDLVKDDGAGRQPLSLWCGECGAFAVLEQLGEGYKWHEPRNLFKLRNTATGIVLLLDTLEFDHTEEVRSLLRKLCTQLGSAEPLRKLPDPLDSPNYLRIQEPHEIMIAHLEVGDVVDFGTGAVPPRFWEVSSTDFPVKRMPGKCYQVTWCVLDLSSFPGSARTWSGSYRWDHSVLRCAVRRTLRRVK